VEVAADLVVLATAMLPRGDAGGLAEKLGLTTDGYGFFNEADPNLGPVDTPVPGIFLAGACQGPRDIPETVAQASGAAAKVLALFAR